MIEPWVTGFTDPGPHAEPHQVSECSCETCIGCITKAAGARVIAAAADFSYDALDTQERAEIRHVAMHVYNAMLDAVLASPAGSALRVAQVEDEAPDFSRDRNVL